MDMSVKNLVNSKFIKSVLKGSSVAELEYIRSKVFQAVDEVIAQKRQEQQDVADKQRKIIEFKKYMAKQGITVADLQVNDESPLAGKKYPPKYRYSDVNGAAWGRCPVL